MAWMLAQALLWPRGPAGPPSARVGAPAVLGLAVPTTAGRGDKLGHDSSKKRRGGKKARKPGKAVPVLKTPRPPPASLPLERSALHPALSPGPSRKARAARHTDQTTGVYAS